MSITETTRQLSFTLDGPAQFELRNHRGDIRCFADSGPGQVRVELSSPHPVDFGPVEQHGEGRRVTVVVPPLSSPDGGRGFSIQLGGLSFAGGSHGKEVDIEVHLPAQSNAQLTTGAGHIACAAELASLRCTTGTGDIDIEAAADATLDTATGGIRVERVTTARLRSGTGDVSVVTAAGDLDLTTGVGDVHLGAGAGDVTITTGSGDVHAHLVSGRLEAKTGAGDIHVSVPAGVAVWRDLSSGFGETTSYVEQHGEPTEGEDYLTVVAHTGVGDVVLTH